MEAIEAELTGVALPQQRYAGLGIRFAARMVDEVIGGVLVYAISFLGSATRAPLIEALALLGGLLVGIGYWVALPALYGATPGKAALRLRIVGADESARGIGWEAAWRRWLAAYVSGFVFCFGYIAIAMDPERRGWHDRFAGTHVLNEGSR